MEICFILIDDHIVVTRQIANQIHPHFIRGERATSIADWQLSHWKQFKVYLLGSLGVTNVKNLNFTYCLVSKYCIQEPLLRQCFANIKMKRFSDLNLSSKVKELTQYKFCPLQFKLVIDEQDHDFLAFFKNVSEKKVTTTKRTSTRKKTSITKPKAKQPVSKKQLIKVKPVYDLSSLNEIKLAAQSSLMQGVVTAKRGSGFVVMIYGFELFVSYMSLNKLTSAQNKKSTDYIPVIDTKLTIEINDRELLIQLPNKKAQAKENA